MRYFQEQGFEVVAPDLFGHGFSDAPRRESAYSFYELAEDTLAIFDKYCKKRNILIGHSYGSSFCTVIARERERKVTKMVLLSGGGPVSLDPQVCNIFCLPSCVLACLKPLLTDAFRRQAFHKPLPRVPSSNFSAFNVPSYVLRGTMQGQYWPEGNQEYHAAVNVAVLLIYGLQDEFVTLDETQWMHETIFASTMETMEAGHMVMLECPDQTNQLIHQFVMKDMIVRPKTGRQEDTHKGTPSPALSRKKTMPHLMPGGISLS
ncbi:putative abhydrolase domain-containing protein 8 [Apostichopus japonicus]|uniref:acylglycerol lipase n=1 Tax=Stichopus japonicus TaxID=307972 RepID=A0A2G8L8Y9_STIJA|nr:putative abhydrolase domain-containing protein 8 [Apostichopus japonicus]